MEIALLVEDVNVMMNGQAAARKRRQRLFVSSHSAETILF